MSHDTYLGDGVYASFDGYHVWLDLRAQDPTVRIALEPEVVDALKLFCKRIREPIKPLPTAPDTSAPCGCSHTFKQHNLVDNHLFPCLAPGCTCIAFQIADPLPCGHPGSEWQDEDLDSTDHYQPAGCRRCREEAAV